MSFFLNPQFLAIAGALISVPIIIHLINRLRFKRLKWAAMEFLLKAQKRNRRRLIIEQLLLLAMRCFLVALLGLLVMRFRGVSFADMGVKQNVHVVLLDDSLSMKDRWKKADGTFGRCFDVARDDILIGKIADKLSKSTSNDLLIVLPLSEALSDKEPAIYKNLDFKEEYDKFRTAMGELDATNLHFNLLDGVKRARKLVEIAPDALISLHVLSDFRKKDWGGDDAAALHKELVDFAKEKAQVRLLDTVDPARTFAVGASAPPVHRENIGVVDLKPRSRMVGKGMPVTFTLSVANYGNDTQVDNVFIYEQKDGVSVLRPEIDFIPPLPLKLKRNEITQVTFEIAFTDPKIEGDEPYFASISAHLSPSAFEKDGLTQDNVGQGMVEVREQVPVLVIDGEGEAGYRDRKKGRDSFFLSQAFRSVPGTGKDDDEGTYEPLRPFRIDFPWREEKDKDGKITKKKLTESVLALERSDLRQYPTIILANVPKLNELQQKNLEKFVEEGGGLAFFMGPLVKTDFYNKNLYNDGKGIFPVPLKNTYYPAEKKEKLRPAFEKGVPMLMLRDDNPKLKPFPIFGAIFSAPDQRELLEHMPVYRYFQAASRPEDHPDKDTRRVYELATLPNDKPIDFYMYEVMNIVGNSGEVDDMGRPRPAKLAKLLENDRYQKYAGRFKLYRDSLRKMVEENKEKPFYLAKELEQMLKDRGTGAKDSVSLEEFWSNLDQQVKELRGEVLALIGSIRFGDPFIFAGQYGKGKVVTVMSTAGNLWHDWVGGVKATAVYPSFIWEMQNYLSAQSSDVNKTLGQRLDVKVDGNLLDRKRPVQMFRTLIKADVDMGEARVVKPKPAESGLKVKDKEQTGKRRGIPDKGQKAEPPYEAVLTFSYPNTTEPGVYLTELFYEDDKLKSDELQAEVERLEGEASNNKTNEELDRQLQKARADLKKVRPMQTAASVFNIDVVQEGNLERVGYDIIKANILDKTNKVQFAGPEVAIGELMPTVKDLSELPELYLLFLAILVAEQALAVHLSFHLKASESLVPAGQPRQKAA